MAFTVLGGSVEVQATEQRAVLWLRDGTWETHIQPVFARGAGAAAWVVPFPVRPAVAEGSHDFFDQLELVTSPVFLKICPEDSGCGFMCGGAADGKAGGGTPGDGDVYVDVWERGTVGDLDYVVLSTADGDDLVGWLEGEGFALPGGSDDLLRDYQTEGVFFFVARIAAGVDPDKPLAPVRFVLPGIDPPGYPLRLTSLGVPAGQSLDLTLWVVFPEDTPFAPSSHPYAELREYPRNREEFDRALELLFQYEPRGTLALLYGGQLSWSALFEEWYCPSCTWENLGIEEPDPWSDEILEIRENESWLYRYQARLDAESMADDLELVLLPAGWWLEQIGNVYEEYTCESDQSALGGALVAAVGLGLVLARRRGRGA